MTISIQEIVDSIIEPVGSLKNTVDNLIIGDPKKQVTGVIVAFVASQYVIQQAINLQANLVITHEGIFYHHHSEKRDYLKNNSVYEVKRDLIIQGELSIYRCHDYIHQYNPDGMMVGLLMALDWEKYDVEHKPVSCIVHTPSMTVAEIAKHIKSKLSLPFVRIVGNATLSCTRIGLLVGFRGGAENAIPLFEDEGVDLIIAGEGAEWEVPEYVKDSVIQGKPKAMLFIGHAASEEPGMHYLAKRIRTTYPNIPVHYIKEKNLFEVI